MLPSAEPNLPNERSHGQTTASLLIDVHYGKLFLVERWNWDRFIRLCSFLKMTPCEVASLVLMPHSDVALYERNNRLISLRARPIAMLLTLLEAHVCRGMTDDIIENPYPDLTKLG